MKARAELGATKFGLIAALNQYAVAYRHLFKPILVRGSGAYCTPLLHTAWIGTAGKRI